MNAKTLARLCAGAALVLAAGCERVKTKTEYVTVTPPDSTYLVEYLPTGASAVGKSTYQLRVRKRSDSSAASGLSIAVTPKMTMPSMTHSAPSDVVAESATPGTYDGAVYYLMESGAGMGYWQLDIAIGAEVHTVYPSVDMAMGTDTVRANLWGPADGSGMMASKFYIFRDGTLTAASGVLSLYVSRAESSLMSFKPVSAGSVLAAPIGTVTSVSVTAAGDAAFTMPISGVDHGNGHWTVDLSSLMLPGGSASNVYLKLRVNGEDKTTDGAAAGAANASATFAVTPEVVVPPPQSTYLVEHLQTGDSVVGKSSFQLRVRNRSDSAPATGLAISLKPIMYMTGMTHSAPATVVTESATPGTYDASVYYLMMSGAGMGYWELQADVAGEVHSIYPSVGMGMGTDTVRRNLWGPGDGMGSMANKYYLFRDGAVTAAAGLLPLHVSRAEAMLMTFKPASLGTVLAEGAITSIAVTAASDAAFTAPLAGVDHGDGHWTIDVSSLGLAAGTPATVYVRLNVNGEDKTTDGMAAGSSNGSTTFTVTPM